MDHIYEYELQIPMAMKDLVDYAAKNRLNCDQVISYLQQIFEQKSRKMLLNKNQTEEKIQIGLAEIDWLKRIEMKLEEHLELLKSQNDDVSSVSSLNTTYSFLSNRHLRTSSVISSNSGHQRPQQILANIASRPQHEHPLLIGLLSKLRALLLLTHEPFAVGIAIDWNECRVAIYNGDGEIVHSDETNQFTWNKIDEKPMDFIYLLGQRHHNEMNDDFEEYWSNRIGIDPDGHYTIDGKLPEELLGILFAQIRQTIDDWRNKNGFTMANPVLNAVVAIDSSLSDYHRLLLIRAIAALKNIRIIRFVHSPIAAAIKHVYYEICSSNNVEIMEKQHFPFKMLAINSASTSLVLCQNQQEEEGEFANDEKSMKICVDVLATSSFASIYDGDLSQLSSSLHSVPITLTFKKAFSLVVEESYGANVPKNIPNVDCDSIIEQMLSRDKEERIKVSKEMIKNEKFMEAKIVDGSKKANKHLLKLLAQRPIESALRRGTFHTEIQKNLLSGAKIDRLIQKYNEMKLNGSHKPEYAYQVLIAQSFVDDDADIVAKGAAICAANYPPFLANSPIDTKLPVLRNPLHRSFGIGTTGGRVLWVLKANYDFDWTTKCVLLEHKKGELLIDVRQEGEIMVHCILFKIYEGSADAKLCKDCELIDEFTLDFNNEFLKILYAEKFFSSKLSVNLEFSIRFGGILQIRAKFGNAEVWQKTFVVGIRE